MASTRWRTSTLPPTPSAHTTRCRRVRRCCRTTSGRAGCTRSTACRAGPPASCCGASCRSCIEATGDAMDGVISTPLVSSRRVGDALVVTLARAPVNAINDELLAQLDAVLDEAEADEQIAVLHLRSALKVFCGGADLGLIRSSVATPQGRNEMVTIVQRMQRVFARLENVGCVTIAELGGATVGGGFELALACDWRIAAHDARIGLPEAGLGLLAAGGGTQRLTRLVGPGIARRLILGAETISGIEAERLGLVQWSVPAERLA